jgi:AcrR family transcriptional regulator
MSELGFQHLSTKEICKRQEISDGTLYKHFRSKDEIILGILEYYFKYDEVIKQTIEMKALSAKESIVFFFQMLSEYYENYPAITAILSSCETLRHEKGVSERVTEIFNIRCNIIVHYVEKGIESKEFRANIDSEGLSDIIIGTFRQAVLRWRMSKYTFSLKQRILLNLDMILKQC